MQPPPNARDSLAGSLSGDPAAQERLLELVYEDLRSLAVHQMGRERANHTLQPTALVHEAFVRLVDGQDQDLRSRTHFLALASTAMRRVLVDHARSKLAAKRGGGARAEPLVEEQATRWEDPTEVLALDEALTRLGAIQPRPARVVELRFFGGLSLEETAAALGVSRDTVKLDWRFARAWLNQALATDLEEPGDA